MSLFERSPNDRGVIHDTRFDAFGSPGVSDERESDAPVGRTGTIFLSDITKVDCALFDPSKGVYGQSWRVDVTLTGVIGSNGIVFDFSPMKKMVRQTLKASIDHALIIPINSQSVKYSQDGSCECWTMRSRSGKGSDLEWEYKSPKGAVFPSRSVALTRQVVEQDFCRSLRHRMPDTITHIQVTLRDEETDPAEAVFRYTHGIAGHDGYCQRLFHGHRSRIQVFIGEERRPDLEHWIARDVLGGNVHIATPSQFVRGMIEPGKRGVGREPVTLRYEASQGTFEATLPAERVFVVEQDTSIECMSYQLALLIKKEENTSERVKVVCFEGIDRGSIVEL